MNIIKKIFTLIGYMMIVAVLTATYVINVAAGIAASILIVWYLCIIYSYTKNE